MMVLHRLNNSVVLTGAFSLCWHFACNSWIFRLEASIVSFLFLCCCCVTSSDSKNYPVFQQAAAMSAGLRLSPTQDRMRSVAQHSLNAMGNTETYYHYTTPDSAKAIMRDKVIWMSMQYEVDATTLAMEVEFI